jgi:creatinine amidohydrolase
MRLRELRYVEIEELGPDIAVLPVGSTEQHGPHAPLGTDSMIAEAMAHAACEETEVLCLPALQIGLAEHHRNFAGTLYVSGETFRRFVYETIESLADHGISNCVIVNNHGSNSASLTETAQQLSWNSPVNTVVWEWTSTRPGDVDHAGRRQTSLMLYLYEDLVAEPVEGDVDEWGHEVHGAVVAHDTDQFTANGASGDAREASAEEGKRLFHESVDELVGLISWLKENG